MEFRGAVDLTTLSSSPASPNSGYFRLFPKTDNRLYMRDSGGADHPVGHPGVFTPNDHGLFSWSYDFAAATSGQAMTGGTIYLIGQQIARAGNATTIYWANQSSGSSLNASQCWAALLNSSGTVLQSVDISSKGGAGSQSATITSQAVVPGFYWIAFLFNGTNLPSLSRGGTISAGTHNVNRTVSEARYATNGTGQTTITNRTPASNTLFATSLWAALG